MTQPTIRAAHNAIDTTRFAPFEHEFSVHPSMTMPALQALAHRLEPTGQCRHISPAATQASAFDHQPAATDGRGLDEVFDQIDQPGAWLALYNVETDPEYAAFLAQVRTEFEPLIAQQRTGLKNLGGFIFISCAPSVTPFHIDRENNFWLQIQGRKTISVWPANDPDVIDHETAEKFILNRDLANVTLQDSIRPLQHDLDMTPGKGLYFPCLAPHMTRCDSTTDDGQPIPSISVGVVFYSDQTQHQARVLACNRLLRRGGLHPRPPQIIRSGERAPIRDRVKAAAGMAAVRLMSRLRDYSAPPGL
ncbi:MAG: cupin domain-containing protein [Burkholderiaceae bacterium]